MHYLKKKWLEFVHKQATKNGYVKKNQLKVCKLPKELSEYEVSQNEIEAVDLVLEREIMTIKAWNVQANAMSPLLSNGNADSDTKKRLIEALDKNKNFLNNITSFRKKLNNFKLEENEV